MTTKSSPLCHALGGLLAIPILATTLTLAALFLLLAWPFAPLVLYAHRRKELSEATTEPK